MSVVGAFRSAVAREDLEAQRVIFDRLVDYSNAHFMAEAMMMRLHAYPDTEAHLVEHRRLLDELSEIRKASSAANLDHATVWQTGWTLVRPHLETYDRPFALFLAEANAHRQGASAVVRRPIS